MRGEPTYPLHTTIAAMLDDADPGTGDGGDLSDPVELLRRLDGFLGRREAAITAELQEIAEVRRQLWPVLASAREGAVPHGATMGQMI